ncbi:MAG: hypothetical protein JW986_08175 [Methanotrichaceae archaeon]|nr:hypothetical protein [Methanotrichaceae archaeon]
MDVSFTAWKQNVEEAKTLSGDSFSFLFDRRYKNRLNRMSRIFFEAYVRATKELASKEDRFPSLSEIDSHMESGAVYAFKDRLMKNTDFFEEAKISGVSYLVPRAEMFIDSSGTYTDLRFDFHNGEVTLPSRRKTPLVEHPLEASEEGKEENKKKEAGSQAPEAAPEESATGESSTEEIGEEGKIAEEGIARKSPSRVSPEIDEERAIEEAPLSKPPDRAEIDERESSGFEEALPPDDHPASAPEREIPDRAAGGGPESPPARLRAGDRLPKKAGPLSWRMGLALIGFVVLAILAVQTGFIFPSEGEAGAVQYYAQLENKTGGSDLVLDIENPSSMESAIEMLLPDGAERSISAKGGVITISHENGTRISLNSSSDASIRVNLSRDCESLPIILRLAVPSGYDAGLVVHGEDYLVNRNRESIILRFNASRERVGFVQSFRSV